MLIEIGAPACLPLGMAKLERGGSATICLLGLSLQHPPVNLFAQAHNTMKMSGARADLAYEMAVRYLEWHGLPAQAEVEIEHAIPAFMGLGSGPILGLSLARALSWLNNRLHEDNISEAARALALGPEDGLAVQSFEQGGLLLLAAEGSTADRHQVIHRLEISHTEKEAWAIVLFFPRVPETVSPEVEVERYQALVAASAHLKTDSGKLVTGDMWQAVNSDDLVAFGQGLSALQKMNQQALARIKRVPELSETDSKVLSIMREGGAVAVGQSPTGLCLYGLVRGGKASRELRAQIRKAVGYYAGSVLATITDNKGAQHVIKDRNLDSNKLKPVRQVPRK